MKVLGCPGLVGGLRCSGILLRRSVRDGIRRANILAEQASYVAGFIDGNGIKIADKRDGLWADRHASATLQAGIPADLKK